MFGQPRSRGHLGVDSSENAPSLEPDAPIGPPDRRRRAPAWAETFPFWAVGIALILGWMGWLVLFNPRYEQAWDRIIPGIWLTIRITLTAFGIAMVIGVITGLARVSTSIIARNLSRLYVEFIRGIPMLILIFSLALVIVPEVANALGWDNRLSLFWRGATALALVYGGYIGEVVRGGIQSVPVGQMEAGRSLGMSRGHTMRSIVLPQAGRAMLPPLGNDFIAMLKDSSLLSVLGILEITQLGRQYASGSFRFRESYLVLTFIYLSLTIVLSLILNRLEHRVSRDRMGERG
jgi:polar amino acid transport system permease protein